MNRTHHAFLRSLTFLHVSHHLNMDGPMALAPTEKDFILAHSRAMDNFLFKLVLKSLKKNIFQQDTIIRLYENSNIIDN